MKKSYQHTRKYLSNPKASKKLTISALWLLGLGIVGLFLFPLIKGLFKRLFAKSTSEIDAKAQKEYINDVENSIDYSNANLTVAQAKGIALNIKKAFAGGGTDEILFFDSISEESKKDVTQEVYDAHVKSGWIGIKEINAVSLLVSTSFLSFFYDAKTKFVFRTYNDDDYKMIYTEFGMQQYGYIFKDTSDLGDWIRGEFEGEMLEKAITPFVNAGIANLKKM